VRSGHHHSDADQLYRLSFPPGSGIAGFGRLIK
jgi:hypothetical protein